VHTLALAEALARAGVDVTVWSLGRGGDTGFFRPVDPAVRIRLVPFADVPDEDVGARILRSIAELGMAFAAAGERYDVVHAQDCISANAVPDCVRTVHHLDRFTTPELAACHERAVVRPRALFCVSGAVAAEVQAGWGRTATVIPNGVDAERFAAAAAPEGAASRGRWRARLGRYVLAVGGIEPRKGTLDLVEAMATVRLIRPDLALVIAGGETLFDYRSYRAAVDARAQDLEVYPLVLGPVPHDELPGLVAEAEVLAFPSTKEGFGLAPMEALAAGVPVVARDLPVLREVFGDAVHLARDVAGIAAGLLAAGDVDPRRVAAGRALAARHTWAAAAQAHLQCYRALVAEGARHPVGA
jgi:glycosyltransferase-like protein